LLAGLLAVFADERGDGAGGFEPPRVDVDAELLERFEIGATLRDLIG
jgi:hypothetical protein